MSGEEQTNEGTATIAANGRVDRFVSWLGYQVKMLRHRRAFGWTEHGFGKTNFIEA